jgi:hypothetical protein
MNEQETSNTPSERQRKYLGRLLAKAHEHGVPYLPTEQLTRAQVSAWIDYLKLVVGDDTEEPSGSSSPYLVTPARKDAPDGYRPPYQLVPEAFDHDHRLDCYRTADEHEIVYCTMCSQEW